MSLQKLEGRRRNREIKKKEKRKQSDTETRKLRGTKIKKREQESLWCGGGGQTVGRSSRGRDKEKNMEILQVF